MAEEKSKHQASRREFVKKAAYIAPAIITLQAAPMYARAGSVKDRVRDRIENRIDDFLDRLRDRLQKR